MLVTRVEPTADVLQRAAEWTHPDRLIAQDGKRYCCLGCRDIVSAADIYYCQHPTGFLGWWHVRENGMQCNPVGRNPVDEDEV